MSYYKIQDKTLTAIGDAVRSKTGLTNAMTPQELVTAINNIESSASPLTCSVSFKYKNFNGYTIYQTSSGWTSYYGSTAKTVNNILVGSVVFIVADKSNSYTLNSISTSNSSNGKTEHNVIQDSSSIATYIIINGDVTITINGNW